MESQNNSDLVLLEVDRYFAELLKWVSKARRKGEKGHALSAVYIRQDKIIASDGYRLHFADMTKITDPHPFPYGEWIVKTIKDRIVVLSPLVATTTFRPDFDGVIADAMSTTFKFPEQKQDAPQAQDQTWKFVISFNPSYLKDVMDVGRNNVERLDFEMRNLPIFTPILTFEHYEYKAIRRAIVMPLELEKAGRQLPFGSKGGRLVCEDYVPRNIGES